MTYPGKGSADFLREGDWNAMCWECGRKKKAADLWKYWQGYWICPRHWNPRQPQDYAKGVHETITPPWVQPMAGYVFTGPSTEILEADTTGPTFTFVPDFSYDPDTAQFPTYLTFNTPEGPLGAYPITTPIVEGVEITLTLQTVSGRLQWMLDGVDPLASRVEISPDEGFLESDDTAAYTVTVTLLTATLSPVSGKTVNLLFSSSGPKTAPPSGVSDVSGVVVFSVTSLAAGEFTVSARDSTDDLTLDSTVIARFGANRFISIFAIQNSELCANDELLVTVTLLDGNSNSVAGKDVTLDFSASGVTLVPSAATTNSEGEASFSATCDDVSNGGTFEPVAALDLTDELQLDTTWEVRFEATVVSVEIAGGENVNVYDFVAEQEYSPGCITSLTIIITAPVTTLLMGGPWEALVECTLVNQSYIYGQGGPGGNATASNGEPGDAGGNALDIAGLFVSVNNTDGYIFGGGGGGGAGGSVSDGTSADALYAACGSGGSGGAGGLPAVGGELATIAFGAYSYGVVGGGSQTLIETTGDIDAGGYFLSVDVLPSVGAQGDSDGPGNAVTGAEANASGGRTSLIRSGSGGDGGQFGEAGVAGDNATVTGGGGAAFLGGAGGAAGKAIELDGGSVTWLGGNDPSRVKGDVS